MRTDLLNGGKINALQYPLSVVFYGDTYQWPLYDICIETGLLRINVSGLLDVIEIGDIKAIVDGNGVHHDIDIFFTDYQP